MSLVASNHDFFERCRNMTSLGWLVIDEWTLHTDFDFLKNNLRSGSAVKLLIHCQDCVHPYYEDRYDRSLRYLLDYFTKNISSRCVWFSLNKYPDLKLPHNIGFYYFPEHHGYYWPMWQDTLDLDYHCFDLKFLCMNKRIDIGRLLTYKKFYTDGLLDQSLFSFLGEDQRYGQFGSTQLIEKENSALDDIAIGHPEIARFKLPTDLFRSIDNDSLIERYKNNKNSYDDYLADRSFYERTFCSVVIETSAFGMLPNFSEKVFRALTHGHPIILIGAPGSLDWLRSQGFDVFDDIFDNSYDQETVHIKRILKVFDVIDNIAAKDIQELKNIKNQINDRLINNRKNYQRLHERMNIKLQQYIEMIQNV